MADAMALKFCFRGFSFVLQDLLDRRYDVKTTDEMFGAICDHLKHATNGGTIRSTITVFRQVSEYISHNPMIV